MFQSGFIINRRYDLVFFISLPFWVLAFALASYNWLSSIALASVALWITLPHQMVTWIRVGAVPEDWPMYRSRFLVGLVVIIATTLLGLLYAPITLLLLVAMWDHQHALMQQHGFSRIYDFKAKAGAPTTGKFDLMLSWALYLNLFLTTPLFTKFWTRELHNYHIGVSREIVYGVHVLSYSLLALAVLVYLVHMVRSVKQGYSINLWKFAFLGASYFLWYFTAWHSDSVLVFGIAHGTMHGIQYIVMVYIYMQRRFERRAAENNTPKSNFVTHFFSKVFQPKFLWMFILMCLAYSVFFQLLAGQPLYDFGIGIFNVSNVYDQAIPELGLKALTRSESFEIYAALLINLGGLLHYYTDSFIWKVRDKKVQADL